MTRKVWIPILLLAALAIAVVAGAASYRAASAAEVRVAQTSTSDTLFGGRGRGEVNISVSKEALAEALGISVEELTTATQNAHKAALAEAVAQGLITQAQADEITANGRPARFGGRWLNNEAIDFEALLAKELNISVEKLQEARASVHNAQIDQAVTNGKLTQEQADLMKGRYALSNSTAYQTAMQSAYEATVQQALKDGTITQAQADQLLANAPSFGGPQTGGRGGHGGFGPEMPGGPRGGERGGRHGGMGDKPAAAPATTTP